LRVVIKKLKGIYQVVLILKLYVRTFFRKLRNSAQSGHTACTSACTDLHDVARHFPELSEVSLLVVDEDVAGDVGRLVAGHDVHERALA
jgi:hypothetical protein